MYILLYNWGGGGGKFNIHVYKLDRDKCKKIRGLS